MQRKVNPGSPFQGPAIRRKKTIKAPLPIPKADLEKEEGKPSTSTSSSLSPQSIYIDLKTLTSALYCPPNPGPPRNMAGMFPLQEARAWGGETL